MNRRKTGMFIRTLRLQHNLSREKLADSLGVFELTIELWERGVLKPTIYDLEMLSVQLKTTVNELLAGKSLKEKNDDEVFAYAEEQRKKENLKLFITSCVCMLAVFTFIKKSKK